MSMPRNKAPKRPQVFICYMKQDLEEARNLAACLRVAGVDPWLDKDKLELGDFYEHEIKKAVGESDAFVPLLRATFNRKGYRQKEVRWAREALTSHPPGEGFIIPFLLERCRLPEWCKSIHAPLDLPVPTPVPAVLKAIAKQCKTTLVSEEERTALVEKKGTSVAAPKAVAVDGAVYWTGTLGEPEWVAISAGEFWMGEGEEAHRVLLGEYRIARVPVTNAQYRLFVEHTGHSLPGHWEGGRPPSDKVSHPVVDVTWFDALAYCRWLSRVTGKNITLPSEAEWEKAARGDKGQRVYPWGDTPDPRNANYRDTAIGGTSAVGAFPGGASPYGCLDMSGNVWEWTRSLWGGYPYPNDPKGRQERENIEAPKTEYRVLRGGSFILDQYGVRCAFRNRDDPFDRGRSVGFRVAVSPLPSGL